MKLMKKALAMFLAAVMIFSTMAIGVSAADEDSVEFQIKFFRKVDGKYVETTKAKPGEDIYARIYCGTSYNAGGASILLIFDNKFLDYQLQKGGKETSATIHNTDYDYINRVSIAEFEDDYKCGALLDVLDEGYVGDDTAKSYGYDTLDEMLDNVNFITTGVMVKTYVENEEGEMVPNTPAPYDISTYIYEIPFKVNDNEYVRSKISGGITIPVDFFRSEEEYMNYSSISKVVGTKVTQIAEMDEFPYTVTTTPASVSINSSITYDANGGKFADGSTSKSTSGIIGSTATKLTEVPTLAKNLNKGWSTSKDGAALSDDESAALSYGYEDVTLYAVWEPLPPADVKYNVNKYFMDTTGAYGAAQTTEETGKDGQTINYTPGTVAGFTFDSTNVNNVLSVTLDEAAPSVANINVYYKRNQHSVIYKDEKDAQLEKIDNVYYEASIPAMKTPYAPTGYDVSWSTAPDKMPDSDVTIKASVTPKSYSYTFSAVDTENKLSGTFADSQPAKLVSYKYMEKPKDPNGELTAPTGYEFDKWDKTIPSEVTDNMSFEARYKAIDYTVTYKVTSVDGIATETNVTKHINDKFNLNEFPKAANGRFYTGWTYNGSTYAPGSEFTMPASDVIFEAKEGKTEYTYTFNAVSADGINGKFSDEETTKTSKYFYGDTPAAPLTGVVAPDGYEFVKWSPEIPSSVTGSETFTATYKLSDYKVTYKVKHTNGSETSEVVYDNKHMGDKFNVADFPVVAGKEYAGWVCNGSTYEPGKEFTMPAADVVFEATEDNIIYTYYFDAATADGTLTGKYGDSTTVKQSKYIYNDDPDDPRSEITAPEGYEFDAWTPAIPSKVTEDKRFNATYKALDYTVTYIVNHADGSETSEVVYSKKHIGDKFNVADLPVVDGMSYSNWTCNDTTYAPGAEFTMPAANVEFETTETKIEYTYTFNAVTADGTLAGKFDGDKTTVENKYYYNDTPDAPADPEAPTGFEFDKWSPAVPEKVTENKTFNATYKAIDYSITYEIKNAPDGVTAPEKAENKHYNDKVTIANLPTVGDGYSIDGWYNGDTKVEAGSEFTMPAEDVTLTAEVSTKKFKVNFDADGGTPVDSIEVEFGGSVASLPETTKDDNDFTGWVDAGTGAAVSSIDSMPANDVNLKATWTRKQYKITYKYEKNVPDGAPEVPAETSSISGETITVEDVPSLDGWTFDGWKFNGVTVTTFEMPKEDVEITGQWRRKGGNLSFYLAMNDDGTPVGEPYSTQWVDEGDAIEAPANDPSQTGSTFLGWVDKDGNELPATMPNADVDAFAKFELNKHTVTYYDSDGITVLEQFDNVTYGSEIPVASNPTPPTHSDPANYEYVFSGWTPKAPEYMPDEDLSFTANYVERRLGSDHTATYMSDGKVVDTFIIHSGEPMQKPEDPTKFGKTFIGWSPEVPAVMPDYDITFEAQWETDLDFDPVIVGGVVVAGAAVAAIATAAAVNTALITGAAIVGGVVVITGIHHVIEHSYNVTYKVNGEVYRTFRIIEGAKIIVPADPTKEGAEFRGWNPEVPERMPAEDIVFEAVWSDTNSDNPSTGSASVGLAAFAAISSAAVAAYLVSKKKKEDEE